MITRVEVLRAAVYAAGATLDGNGVEAPERAVSVAKILASKAAAACGKDCVQVHGGMGYTWEVDAHLFLKRAWALDLTFGDGGELAELLAEDLVS
jgi:alkylation response protein AidB-like acyl-CoA dehydrogenase